MAFAIAPAWRQQFFDANGAPLAGGFLYFYIAGTSTPQDTYTTSTGTVAANPIELDSSGYTPNGMFWANASYKIMVTDANGVPQLNLSQDGVASTGLSSAQVGSAFFPFAGEQETVITDTSYPSGTSFDKCVPSSAWFSIDSANLVGTYGLSAMMKSDGGITTSVSLVNLSDGAPDTPIVTLTSTSATGERQVSSAITFASGGAAKVYAIKAIVSSGVGYVWSVNLVKLT